LHSIEVWPWGAIGNWIREQYAIDYLTIMWCYSISTIAFLPFFLAFWLFLSWPSNYFCPALKAASAYPPDESDLAQSSLLLALSQKPGFHCFNFALGVCGGNYSHS